ncbi:RNA polymerase sigma factor [Amycolatopsis sp. H6(2020)]|nr:RNA polymerase sigma factor [Amycolatopsis sp. H6(2020)]
MDLRKSYYAELAGFAVKLGSSVSDARMFADDAIVELVLRAMTQSGPEPVLNHRAWLYGAVRNMVLGARRQRRRIDDTDVHQLTDRWCQTTWGSPDLHFEAAETLRAIEALPEDQRDALVLRLAGHTTADIAELLGISADAAKKRVSRARKRLLQQLEGRDA